MSTLKIKNGTVWEPIVAIKGEKGEKGDAGESLPAGGVAGQLLIKNSATDNDATWQNNPSAPLSHGHSIGDVTNLQTTLDGKSSTAHLHDDRYYTETEVDATFAPKANPVFTGTQTLPNIVTNGIKFPATQVPSADPNTLDDYEEGTWAPTTATPNLTISINGTSYTKIGNMVFAKCYIIIENTSGSIINTYQISGLPFVSFGYGFATNYFYGSQKSWFIETGGNFVNFPQDLDVGSNLRMYQFVYNTF